MNRQEGGVTQGVFVDAAGVLAAWTLLLLLEVLLVATIYRDEFSGSWEVAHARWSLSPVALAALVPFAFGVVGLGHLVVRRSSRSLAALALATTGLAAYGVSGGRHFASAVARVPFIAAVALTAALVTFAVVRRAPTPSPRVVALGGLALAGMAWLADAFVLPRLYPAFHLALFATTLIAWASLWAFLRTTPTRVPVAALGALVALASFARMGAGARTIATDDNLRRILVEHAPVLGRAVFVAAELAPPPPLDDADEAPAAPTRAAPAQGASRALDWAGRDIVLFTVDALRADHVSAYGYGRETTPNVDRLASRGALFSRAYCATPHTSYSITSLMTGKYMRPLLTMGVGQDSETWADHLRRYGFRTAAFYPPAVFFIDTHRFTALRDRALGFEYAKIEFAPRARRIAQVAAYLEGAPKDAPLFLWVHAFEPHEPYEMHAEHPFSGQPVVDAYDSEIAEADALFGEVVALVEQRRPGAVVIFTADHGEEFGDHGGRYHGTTVYEEQVRVPLVIAGPGVGARVVDAPVQTIDLLPTTLAALDVPLPARIRGRDLGPAMATGTSASAASAAPGAPGDSWAFAETDDYTLAAQGTERLVCARKAAACTLFDLASDPNEHHPVGDRPERVRALRRRTLATERDNGRVEAAQLPEALRRGLQGDREAAEDILPLFDDVRIDVRRKAAECAFRLRAHEMLPQLKRALRDDEDPEVRDWSALALVRLGRSMAGDAGVGQGEAVEPAALTATERIVSAGRGALSEAAALALAERGDARGEDVLLARWTKGFGPETKTPGELGEARELLEAFSTLRAKTAAPVVSASLDDVRLRPYIVDALATIGDARARGPLLEAFTNERYLQVRPAEARALIALGARRELSAPLKRFAGVPEPLPHAVDLAEQAGILDGDKAAYVAPKKRDIAHVRVVLRLEGEGPARLFARVGQGPTDDAGAEASRGAELVARVGQTVVPLVPERGNWTAELDDPGSNVTVEVDDPRGIEALWLVRRAPELAPPPPVAWSGDAGSPEVPGGPGTGP